MLREQLARVELSQIIWSTLHLCSYSSYPGYLTTRVQWRNVHSALGAESGARTERVVRDIAQL